MINVRAMHVSYSFKVSAGEAVCPKPVRENLPVVPRNNVGRTIVDPSQRETLRYSGCGPPQFRYYRGRSLALESARTYEDGGPKAFSNFLRASVDETNRMFICLMVPSVMYFNAILEPMDC